MVTRLLLTYLSSFLSDSFFADFTDSVVSVLGHGDSIEVLHNNRAANVSVSGASMGLFAITRNGDLLPHPTCRKWRDSPTSL